MSTGKMFIGAVFLIGAFVAMAWFGWFGPVTKSFQAIKKKHGPASRQALISQYLARQRTKCNDDGQELLYPDIETHHAVVNRTKEARVTPQSGGENPPTPQA